MKTVWALGWAIMVSLVDAFVAVDQFLANFINGVDWFSFADSIVPLEIFVVQLTIGKNTYSRRQYFLITSGDSSNRSISAFHYLENQLARS